MAPAVQIIGLAIMTVSAVKQHEQGKKAAAAQNRAYAAQREAQEEAREQQRIGTAADAVRQRQQMRQSLREQRIRRGRIMQAAEAGGSGAGSGQFGSTGALGTLTGAQIGALGTQRRASAGVDRAGERGFQHQQRAGAFQQTSLGHQQRASMWQGVGQIGGSIFQGAGGFPGMADSLFPTQNPSSVQVTDLRP